MDPTAPTADDLQANARKLLRELRCSYETGDNAAIKASRIALGAGLIEDATAAGHLLSLREFDAVYYDTLEAYRPILAGFLVDVLRGLSGIYQRRTAIAAALPRLAAALPEPRCAVAVAHAWNFEPYPIGANSDDARAGIWLSAEGGKLAAVDDKGAPHWRATTCTSERVTE